MSLIARRLLGSLLIVLVVAVSFASAEEKPREVRQPVRANQLFVIANKLAYDKGKIPKVVVVEGNKVGLTRRGQYSRLCIDNGCALLKDNSPRFKVVFGADAKTKIWEQRQ